MSEIKWKQDFDTQYSAEKGDRRISVRRTKGYDDRHGDWKEWLIFCSKDHGDCLGADMFILFDEVRVNLTLHQRRMIAQAAAEKMMEFLPDIAKEQA